MERNHNEQQIVMSIEHYRSLLGMADRSRCTTKNIERHVRKHNPFLQLPHQKRVEELQTARSERQRKCRHLIADHAGEIVFVETSVNFSYFPLEEKVYTPMILKCINKTNRGMVDVYKLDETGTRAVTWGNDRVTPDCIAIELPDDYIQLCTGSYRTLYVKQYSPMHWYTIEQEAHCEDMARTEHAARSNTQPKDVKYVQRICQNALKGEC